MARVKKTADELEAAAASLSDVVQILGDVVSDLRKPQGAYPPMLSVELNWKRAEDAMSYLISWGTKLPADVKAQLIAYKGGIPPRVAIDREMNAKRKKPAKK